MPIGKPNRSYVEIDGVNLSAFLRGWSLTNTYQNIMVKFIKIIVTKKTDELLDFSEELNGKRVIVKRGGSDGRENWVLKGEVVNVKPKGSEYEIIAADRYYETQKESVSTTFDKDIDPEGGVISEIFKTLVEENSTLTVSAEDSGTGTILSKFSCNAAQLFERLETLTEAINWQSYYSEDIDKVVLENKGFSEFDVVLEVGNNIVNSPQWDEDSEELYNEVEIRGATQTVETTETGQVDVDEAFTAEEVSLSFKPISVRVYADSSNPPTTLRTGGVERSSADYDYEVDVDRRKIIWNSDKYAPSTGDYVQVDYSYPIPTPSTMRDDASILTYSPDPDNPKSKKKVMHKLDISTVSDSETYGWNYLEKHKDPIITAKLNVTNVTGLRVGHLVSIVDSINGISGQFFVTKIKKVFPYRYDTITVVSNIIDKEDSAYAQDKRIKRLEEQSLGDEEIIQNVILETAPFPYEGRDLVVLNRDVSPDYLWGNTNWTWSDSQYNWQGEYTNEPTVAKKSQYRNEFKEFIYDSDYYDSTNSTNVTWDTSAQSITITGQLETDLISKGEAFNTVIPKLANVAGNPRVSISADGKATWQQVTLNTVNTLENSNENGVYLRIEPDAAGETFGEKGLSFPIQLQDPGRLDLFNTYENTGSYKEPAIYLKFN